MSTTTPLPRWVPLILIGAFFYYAVAGIAAMILPVTTFTAIGLPPPSPTWVVRLAGLITALFGLGFLLAATAPLTHWSFIVLGFAAQVAVPLFFLLSIVSGSIPVAAGGLVILSDGLWAVLLGLVLRRLYTAAFGTLPTEPVELRRGLSLPVSGSAETLDELSNHQPILLVCLRHSGCTFCRETLARVQRLRPEIERRGMKIVLASHADLPGVEAIAGRYGLGDAPIVSDPERLLYRALELRRGSPREVLGLTEFRRALLGGLLFRHGVAMPTGDPFQLAGTFVIHRGKVVAAHRPKTAGEAPDLTKLVDTCPIEQ